MEDEPDVKYCRNCQRNIVSQNFVSHNLHCEKNIQLCRLCQEPVPRIELTNHLEENHKLEQCDYCNKPFEIWKMKDHQTECIKRPVACKYCEKQFACDAASGHEMQCGSRTEKCGFCDMFVQMKYKDSHPEICQYNKCPKRMISCEYCSLELPDVEYTEHVLNCGSRTEKCNTCGRYVLYKNKRNHEENCEKNKCPKRMISCEYCSLELPDVEYTEHVLNCGSHTEKCNTCGRYVLYKNKRNHEENCEKNNYLKTLILCKHCEVEIPCDEYSDHELNCKLNWVKCPTCNDFFSRRKLKAHKRECDQIKHSKMEGVRCKYCEIEFPFDILMNHENDCDLKVEQCYRCSKFVKIKDFDLHRKQCSKDSFIKDVGKGAEADCSYIEYAQEAECAESSICSYCNVNFPISCFLEHIETCGERIEICPTCMDEVKYKEKARHIMICKKKGLFICEWCNVEFPAKYFGDHVRNCMEGTENCPICKLPVMRRDKEKHLEGCKKIDSSHQKCPICCSLVASEELKSHYDMCIAANSENYFSQEVLKVTYNSDNPEPMDFTESNMHSKNSKSSSKDLLKPCPYCSDKIIERLFNNHKMFCQKALKVCPLCEETFHIENEQIHTETCPSLKQIENSQSSFTDHNNPYNSRSKDASYRSFETKYKNCPHCDGKIIEHSYEEHIKLCVKELKTCKFCKEKFKIDHEREHLRKCTKITKDSDKFAYPGFADTSSGYGKKQNKGKKYETCNYCNYKIPKENVKDHFSYCSGSYTGTKQKRPDMKEERKPGVLKTIYNYCFNKTDNSLDQQDRRIYPYDVSEQRQSIVHPRTEAPSTYSTGGGDYENPQFSSETIPCEFCSKDILIDKIIEHESGCRPDLVSFAPVSQDLDKNLNLNTNREWLTQGSIQERNNYSLLERKSKLEQENNAYMEEFHRKYPENNSLPQEVPKTSKSFYSSVSGDIEGTKHINAMKKLHISDNNDRKDQKFNCNNPLDFQNDRSEFELNASKENYSYARNMDQKYNMKNYLRKDTVNESIPKNILSHEVLSYGKTPKPEETMDYVKGKELSKFSYETQEEYIHAKQMNLYDNESKEKYCTASSVINESSTVDSLYPSRVMTKPGEFLNKTVHVEQCKSTSDASPPQSRKSHYYSMIGENSLNQDKVEKLHSTWKTVDADIVQLSQQKHHHYQKSNRKSAEISAIGTVEISGIGHSVSGHYANADRISDNVSNVKQIDIQKARICTKIDSRFSRNESGNVDENYQDNSKTESNHPNLEVHADDVLDGSDYSIISSSQMKGAVKIDRLVLKKKQAQPIDVTEDYQQNQDLRNIMGENYHCALLNQSSIKCSLKNEYQNSLRNPDVKIIEHQHPNITSLNSNSDLFTENSNEIALNKQLIEKDNESSYHKFLTKNSDPQMNDLSVMYVRGKNYHEFNENEQSEIKDNNLDSYFQFISSNTDNLQIKSCNVCGNEMCVCDIKKNLDSARKLNDSGRRRNLDEKSENKDSDQFYEKPVPTEATKNEEFSNICFVNDGSNEKMAHIWKWREGRTASDSE